jgi:hypothetical protein
MHGNRDFVTKSLLICEHTIGSVVGQFWTFLDRPRFTPMLIGVRLYYFSLFSIILVLVDNHVGVLNEGRG